MHQRFLQFMLGLMFLLFSNSQSVAEECETQDWLVQTHHLAKGFEKERNGPKAEKAAKQLRRALDQYPVSQLGTRLRTAGLAKHGNDIVGFLRTQNSLVESQLLWGGTTRFPPRLERKVQEFSSRMQKLVPGMRCASDQNWRPKTALAGLGDSTPLGAENSSGNSLFFPPNAAVISFAVFGLMAALAGGSVAMRFRTKRRHRRARRLPCALSCTVTFIETTATGDRHAARRGRMCDISQLGAKVCLDSPVPLALNTCTVQSHHWATSGRIIWRNAQCMGVAFKRALPRQELLHLVRLNRKLHAGKENGAPEDAVIGNNP